MFEGFGDKIDNPEQKYYWLVYADHENGQSVSFEDRVLEHQHPFTYINDRNNGVDELQRLTLLNWREITKEEYDLFNS